MVITVYVLRTSKCGLLFHCSKFCSRQNRKTCIKYVEEQHWHQGRGKYRQSMEQASLEWLLWSLAVKELLCCCNHLSIGGTLILQAFMVKILQVWEWGVSWECLCACCAFLVRHGDCGLERKETEAVISVVGSRLFTDLWTN